MKKRFLVALACAALLLTIAPATALATPQTYTMDFSMNGLIDWNGSHKDYSKEDDSGAGWSWNASEKQLTLDGLDFETSEAIACKLPDGARLVLNGTSTMKSTYFNPDGDNLSTFGLDCIGSLTVRGTGSLAATGGATKNNESSGIKVEKAITVEGGTLEGKGGSTSSAASYGINCGEGITVNKGCVIGESDTAVTTRKGLGSNTCVTTPYKFRTTASGSYTDAPPDTSATARDFDYYEIVAYSITGVTVTPSSASVAKGGMQQFSATVTSEDTDAPAQTVTWGVAGGSAGTTIDAHGNLTVAVDETATTLSVTATSTVDTTKSKAATVAVTAPAPTMKASPTSLDFGSFTFGSVPAAQVVTITNTGSNSNGFDLPSHTEFTIVAIEGFSDGVALVAPGGHAKFSVQPKASIPVGDYNGVIRITFRDSTGIDIPTSFTVNAASNAAASKTAVPKTGDSAGPLAGLCVLLAAGGGLAASEAVRRKQ